ncbi:beta-propeller fold lactonase family protein [Novosphingobium sp. 9U]|uniref:lactonase family protein n=1 Tax=Novosphingobium sp. 9U TaxID=2653158 RepID=UPI0012F4591D|nr:beta-propeller fold lactonase family protein [Novosphingobium sp. 9U]VWX55133.1 conserved hypothetical protein [Novosphingobium sp. 9U]
MANWVGSYREKGGEGFYRLERDGGRLMLTGCERAIEDASYVVWSDRHRLAYMVEEKEEGRIATWRFDGAWEHVASLPSGGALPCFLSLSPDGHTLACANYGDGTLTTFALDPESGAPRQLLSSYRPSGHGPVPERQEGPHAHCAVFDGDDVLYHVDLGLDRVFRHELERGRIVASAPAFSAPSGAGPRHLLLHPDAEHDLLVCELSAQLLLLRREGPDFACVGAVPTCPHDGVRDNLGGHLALDRDGTVLVTNRGHDSLVRFAIDGEQLHLREWSHTGGSSPRHLMVDRGQVIVAHEEGGGVAHVSLNAQDACRIANIPGAAFLIEIPDVAQSKP